jgi:hypothetical protein
MSRNTAIGEKNYYYTLKFNVIFQATLCSNSAFAHLYLQRIRENKNDLTNKNK